MPPPSPPTTPQVFTQQPPPAPQNPLSTGPTVPRHCSSSGTTTGGGVQYFVHWVLNRRAMYRFAVQQPNKNPLLMSEEGMQISRL